MRGSSERLDDWRANHEVRGIRRAVLKVDELLTQFSGKASRCRLVLTDERIRGKPKSHARRMNGEAEDEAAAGGLVYSIE